MANEVKQFFRDHGISEVEAIIPDMAGIARGKIMPAQKFTADEGMRLPESIFLQTVTGDYPVDTSGAMSAAEIDIVPRAPRAGDPRLFLFGWPARDDGAAVRAAACAGTLCRARLGAGDCARAGVLSHRTQYRCGL